MNRRYFPLPILLTWIAYLGWAGWVIWRIVDVTGEFTYGLDDAYIHLTVAGQWAETGTMGINPGEFAAASSSPLFTVLLALSHLIFGKSITFWTPLFLNFVASLGVIHWMGTWIQKHKQSPWWIAVALVAGLLVPMTMSGMEHLLHAWILLICLKNVSEIHSSPESSFESYRGLLLPLFFLGGIRFEGLAAAGIMVLYLLWKDRSWRPVVVGIIAILPVLAFAALTYSESGMILPNSVYMKLNPPKGLAFVNLTGSKRLFGKVMTALTGSPLVLPALVTLMALILSTGKSVVQRHQLVFPGVALCILFLHILGSTFVTVRYEVYLMMLVIACLMGYGKGLLIQWFPTMKERQDQTGWFMAVVLIIGLGTLWMGPVYRNIYMPQSRVIRASQEIHQQQGMMARFTREFLSGERVAINDLGRMSYESEAGYILDLEGLGSTAVTLINKEGAYSWNSLRELMDSLDISYAMIYDDWYAEVGLTEEGKVGSWEMEDIFILGGTTVSFYCWDPEKRAGLLQSLQTFESRLPEEVIVSYE